MSESPLPLADLEGFGLAERKMKAGKFVHEVLQRILPQFEVVVLVSL